MLLEQRPKFTQEDTETLGDIAKNRKLVRVTSQNSDREWISFRHASRSNPCPSTMSHLNPLCPLNVLEVTMLKHCITLAYSDRKG